MSRHWRAVVGILAVLALSTCNRASMSSEPVKVGSILGLTGDNATYGQKMLRGLELAVASVNDSGGINGRRLTLRPEDSQFDPARAVTAYRKLTGADGVRIIVGITGSRNAIPVVQAARSDSVVIVDAVSSAPMLTTVAGLNYLRIMPSDALAGRYNVAWAREAGMRRPFILYVEDDWGASYRDALMEDLRSSGVTNLAAEGITAGTRDFRTQVQRMRAAAPDAVFLLVYAKEGASLMQQIRQAHLAATVYGSDNISTPEFVAAGAAVVEGVRVALPAEFHGPAYTSFSARYRAKYHEAPDVNALKSYDALLLTVEAIRRVGEDPMRIRDYLRSADYAYVGATGELRFDSHGDLRSQSYSRMIYRAGVLVPFGEGRIP